MTREERVAAIREVVELQAHGACIVLKDALDTVRAKNNKESWEGLRKAAQDVVILSNNVIPYRRCQEEEAR